MNAFDYLSVMISIVLGLGVAQLLTSLGQLIRERRTVKPYWLTVVWILILLLIHVQTWWTMFGMRDHASWTFPAFFAVLLQPIGLYLLSSLLTPDLARGRDMKASYYEQRVAVQILFLVLIFVSIGKELAVEGRLPVPANLAAHGVFMALAGLGAATGNRRVHEVLGPTVLAFLLLYIGALFLQLET